MVFFIYLQTMNTFHFFMAYIYNVNNLKYILNTVVIYSTKINKHQLYRPVSLFVSTFHLSLVYRTLHHCGPVRVWFQGCRGSTRT